MRKLRRVLVTAVAVAGLVVPAGPALANPPDSDPTCGHGQQSGQECAGDNGSDGCEGANEADENRDENSDDGFGLVTDILSEGEEGDCS